MMRPREFRRQVARSYFLFLSLGQVGHGSPWARRRAFRDPQRRRLPLHAWLDAGDGALLAHSMVLLRSFPVEAEPRAMVRLRCRLAGRRRLAVSGSDASDE